MTIGSKLSLSPNLIMPGVAKCGTTTLHDILVRHPAIAGGHTKELNYLLDEGDELLRTENIRSGSFAGWMQHYPDKGSGGHRYWLDASPQYQFQQTAFDTVSALIDKPRLIFIVRSPSRRLFSMYQYARYQFGRLPHIKSFAQFIDEIRPPASPSLADQRMLVNAFADSRYDEMLERWSAIVPDGNVLVTSLEALVANQADVITDLGEWLGLDPLPMIAPDLEPSNPTIRVRNHTLLSIGGRLAERLPNKGLMRKTKTFARNLLVDAVPRDEIGENAGILAELDREFAPSVARFNQMAGQRQRNFKPLPH